MRKMILPILAGMLGAIAIQSTSSVAQLIRRTGSFDGVVSTMVNGGFLGFNDGSDVLSAEVGYNNNRMEHYTDETALLSFDGMSDGNLELGDLTVNGTCTGCSGGGVTTGQFVATFETGFTADLTATFEYVTDGERVSVKTNDLVSGTSDSTNFLASADIPADLRPAEDQHFVMVSANDNGVQIAACIFFEADGDVRLLPWASDGRCGVTVWTASGSKNANFGSGGYGSNAFTWVLN